MNRYFKNTVKAIIKYAVSRNFLKKRNILLKKQSFEETRLLAIDRKKAKKFLRWSPKLNFYETLEYTFEWYKKYFQNQNMEIFTLLQLKKYLKK